MRANGTNGEHVIDQRAKRWCRYESALVLMLLANLADERTMLTLPCACVPCANTYCYICSHIGVDELNQALGRIYAQASAATATRAAVGDGVHATTLPADPRRQEQLSFDGKCLLGTCDAGASPATSALHGELAKTFRRPPGHLILLSGLIVQTRA